MLEMLKERKAALEAQGKKGFTLMEMLIVIAIIAILIAIAIPIFTTQMNAAKQAADEANARSLYALLVADYMDDGSMESDAPTAGTLLSAGGTVNAYGQSFTFSDLTSNLAYTAATGTGATATGPIVTVTTNDVTQTYGG